MPKSAFSRGFLYSCGILFNRIVPERLFRFRIFRIFELFPSQERRSGDRGSDSPSDQLTFRWCESEEDFAAAQKLTYYRPTESSGANQKCCLAVDWADAVGGVWIATEFFDESDLGVRIRLNHQQSWLFAAFIERSHRRRGIYRRLVNQALSQQPRSVRTYASINPTNKASIAAHRQYIQRTVGTCVVMRVLGKTVCWGTGDLQIRRKKTPTEIEIF